MQKNQNQNQNQVAQKNSGVLTAEKMATTYANELTEWIAKDMQNPMRGIRVPSGYDWQNEIASAMLYIAQNVTDKNRVSALQCCTKDSIMSGLRDMVLQGLSVSKKQIYPIVYGNKLQMMRSYFGTIALISRLFPNYRVTANVIHGGDKYEIAYDEEGSFHYIRNHETSLETLDNPIAAAYGTITDKETGKILYACIMTKKEIDTSWSHAKTDTVQKEFPQEMAKRTLINRMCKIFINTAQGISGETIAAYNRSTEAEYENDDSLTNVTPPETEAEKQRMIRSKSAGQAGLKAALSIAPMASNEQDSEETPQNASDFFGQEITPSEQESASETPERASERNLGSKPSVRIDENGEVVPNDDDEQGGCGIDDDLLPF